MVTDLRQCEDGLLESLAWRSDSCVFQLLSSGGPAASASSSGAADSNGQASAAVILGKGSSHALRMFFAHVLLLTEVRLKKLLERCVPTDIRGRNPPIRTGDVFGGFLTDDCLCLQPARDRFAREVLGGDDAHPRRAAGPPVRPPPGSAPHGDSLRGREGPQN